MRGVRVRREDLGQPLLAERPGEAGAGQLVVVVAAQVPGHRLEPGQGVDRRPRARPGSSGTCWPSTTYSSAILDGEPMRVDVGVDPVGVGLEVLPRRGGQRAAARPRRPGASPCVRITLSVSRPPAPTISESRPGGDVPAQVHLEEPVLGGDVALGPEQVLGVVGVDLRHALVVAQDVDRRREPAHRPARPRSGGTSGGRARPRPPRRRRRRRRRGRSGTQRYGGQFSRGTPCETRTPHVTGRGGG